MLRARLNPPARRPVGDPVRGLSSGHGLRVMGGDMSLTASGLSTIHGSRVLSETLKPKPQSLRGAERLDNLERRIKDRLVSYDPALVVIEGYSFGSKNGRERIGEWGGVLRLTLYRMGIPYIEVSPNQVKQFATLSGAAAKSLVMKELFKRFDVDRDDDNQADAVVLALIGVALLDENAIGGLTKQQLDVLAKIRKEQAEGCNGLQLGVDNKSRVP